MVKPRSSTDMCHFSPTPLPEATTSMPHFTIICSMVTPMFWITSFSPFADPQKGGLSYDAYLDDLSEQLRLSPSF